MGEIQRLISYKFQFFLLVMILSLLSNLGGFFAFKCIGHVFA